jgi:hypothetical protein
MFPQGMNVLSSFSGIGGVISDDFEELVGYIYVSASRILYFLDISNNSKPYSYFGILDFRTFSPG